MVHWVTCAQEGLLGLSLGISGYLRALNHVFRVLSHYAGDPLHHGPMQACQAFYEVSQGLSCSDPAYAAFAMIGLSGCDMITE